MLTAAVATSERRGYAQESEQIRPGFVVIMTKILYEHGAASGRENAKYSWPFRGKTSYSRHGVRVAVRSGELGVAS